MAGWLQGLHAMAAWGFGPHWLLNDADAKAFGTAVANAMRHLPMGMSQKAVDFSTCAMAIITYEAPRLAFQRNLHRRQQAAPQGPRPAQVFQFRPAQAPPPAPPQAAPQAPFGDMTYEPEAPIDGTA